MKKLDFSNVFVTAMDEDNCKRFFPRVQKFFLEAADKRYTAEGTKPFETAGNSSGFCGGGVDEMVRHFLGFGEVFSKYLVKPRALFYRFMANFKLFANFLLVWIESYKFRH